MRAVSLDGVWELAYGPQQAEDVQADPARWREGRTCIPAKAPSTQADAPPARSTPS